MERESFVFYRSFYDCVIDLNDKQTRELVVAICERALNGNETEINDKIVKMAYNLIKPQLDANTKRYVDGCKGGGYGTMGGRPKSTLENSEKPQWGKKNNPSGSKLKTPNDNDNDNVNDNVNENDNEKEYEEKREASNTLDANASRSTVEKRAVGKTLSEKLSELGLENEVIELAVIYDGCKKGKKLSKFKDQQLKIRVNKLRKNGFNTIEGMKQVLENSIAGGYEGIFELKTKPEEKEKVVKEGEVIQRGGYNFYIV